MLRGRFGPIFLSLRLVFAESIERVWEVRSKALDSGANGGWEHWEVAARQVGRSVTTTPGVGGELAEGHKAIRHCGRQNTASAAQELGRSCHSLICGNSNLDEKKTYARLSTRNHGFRTYGSTKKGLNYYAVMRCQGHGDTKNSLVQVDAIREMLSYRFDVSRHATEGFHPPCPITTAANAISQST